MALETFIHNVKQDVSTQNPQTKANHNLSKHKREALRFLPNYPDIIIKPADKESAVVVMDKEHYISEAKRQLGDTTYYKRLHKDPTSYHQRLVKEKLTEILNLKETSEDNLEYLTVTIPEQADSISSPKYTNLPTLDARLRKWSPNWADLRVCWHAPQTTCL